LNLGYLAAVLLKEEYNVNIIDLTIEDVDYNDLSKRLKDFNPDIIGITALSHEYVQVKRMSVYLKETCPCPVILGGHLATHSYKMVLEKTDIDICVLGEGELTIIDLLKNLSHLEKVKGIAYKNGKTILNEQRELISDLDTIPFPAYELFDIDKYSALLMNDIYLSKKYLRKRETHKKMSLEAGRGCPFACDFCSKIFKKIRRRSVGKIIEEIIFLKDNYNIDIFGFQDELLFASKEYISDFCRQIEPLKINWYGNARIDTVDKEMLDIITGTGCLLISYGVESGSKKILKNMNKKITPSKIEETLKNTLKIGMPIDMGLILGYPGEDRSTVQDTIEMLAKVGYPGLKFRYITPYPGSPLYNRCIENGKIKSEEDYLESLGDGTGPYRFRINFTDFTDDELINLVPEITQKVFRNYLIYLLKHPVYLIKYLIRRDVMNPVFYYYNKLMHPTNYDKAAQKK